MNNDSYRKKEIKKICLNVGMCVLGIGIMILVISYQDIIIAFNEPVDIMKETGELNAGMTVDTELNALLECFKVERIEHIGKSSRPYDMYYYILPVYGNEETYYIALQVAEKEKEAELYAKLSKSAMQRYRYHMNLLSYNSNSVNVTGGIKKLDKYIYQEMLAWFEKEKLFENDLELKKYVLPLMLDTFDLANTRDYLWGSFTLMSIGACIVIVVCNIGRKSKRMGRLSKKLRNVNLKNI